MNKIIFLDIDGVLNYQKHFQNIYLYKRLINKVLNNTVNKKLYTLDKTLEINLDNIQILKEIIFKTNAKVIIISSWLKLSYYPLIENYLIHLGIPIIDNIDLNLSREKAIENYLVENIVDEYIILDDSKDYYLQSILFDHLIWTDFYDQGLDDYHKFQAINILNKKNLELKKD